MQYVKVDAAACLHYEKSVMALLGNTQLDLKQLLCTRPLVRHKYFVAASCKLRCKRAIDRSSRAGYRSILALTSLANTRAGQSERRVPPVPIRTPEAAKGEFYLHIRVTRLNMNAPS